PEHQEAGREHTAEGYRGGEPPPLGTRQAGGRGPAITPDAKCPESEATPEIEQPGEQERRDLPEEHLGERGTGPEQHRRSERRRTGCARLPLSRAHGSAPARATRASRSTRLHLPASPRGSCSESSRRAGVR